MMYSKYNEMERVPERPFRNHVAYQEYGMNSMRLNMNFHFLEDMQQTPILSNEHPLSAGARVR